MMYIKMDKGFEDAYLLRYNFETKIQGDSYEHRGKIRYHLMTVQGSCVFNKQTGTFEIDTSHTHAYFLQNLILISFMKMKLTDCYHHNKFPSIIDIATG